MRADLVIAALDAAKRTRGSLSGAIFHSDHGTQGGFNWSSQHLDHEGGPRFRALPTGQLAGQY
jgi:transposase InsO family protein